MINYHKQNYVFAINIFDILAQRCKKLQILQNISVLLFSAVANFWAILGNFWAILAILGHFWANLGNFESFLGYFG